MNPVQQKLLTLLEKFDQLCKQYEIVYYLGGGNTIGALRHKGFIPWDDDIDLYMNGKNYNKLLSVQDEFFSDDFILVNSENFPKYGNVLPRFVDTHSTVIGRARIADDTPKGQFLELFVFDPMPRDKDEQELWLKKHWIYAELMAFTYRVANDSVQRYTDEKMYYEYVEKCKKFGKQAVLKELEDELFSIDEKDSDEYCSRWGIRNLIYRIDWFQEQRYVPYEYTEMPIAKYAENMLRSDYGDDWMYIPEPDNQIVHPYTSNMNISYQNYIDDYSQFVNMDEVFEVYEDRKKKLMELYFINKKNHLIRQKIKTAQVQASLEYNADKSNIDFEALIKNESYDQIEEFFKVWYDNQFHKSFWGWDLFISLDDDMLYYALLPLLLKGGFSRVRKTIMMREREGELSTQLSEMLDFTNAIRDVYVAIDNSNETMALEALARCDSMVVDYKQNQFDYRKLKVTYALKQDDRDLDALKRTTQTMLEDYPDNGEIISLYADVLYAQQDYQNALAAYEDAYPKTNHGFIRIHIKDRIDAMKGGN